MLVIKPMNHGAITRKYTTSVCRNHKLDESSTAACSCALAHVAAIRSEPNVSWLLHHLKQGDGESYLYHKLFMKICFQYAQILVMVCWCGFSGCNKGIYIYIPITFIDWLSKVACGTRKMTLYKGNKTGLGVCFPLNHDHWKVYLEKIGAQILRFSPWILSQASPNHFNLHSTIWKQTFQTASEWICSTSIQSKKNSPTFDKCISLAFSFRWSRHL